MKEIGIDRTFNLLNNLFLFLCSIVMLYPIIYILSASLSNPVSLIKGDVWLFPVKFSLESYKAVIKSKKIMTGFFNSSIYMILGTIVSVTLTLLAAYPLSRKNFFGKNVLTFIFAFTMLFSGGIIPYWLLIKSLGMLNLRLSMVIPGALSVWNVIITRTFIQSNIPEELHEAAVIDGCYEIRFFSSVVVPLSRPIIAVMALIYAVRSWNSYFNALLFLNDPGKFPLQLILRQILVLYEVDTSMLSGYALEQTKKVQDMKEVLKYAVIVVASAPLMIIYPFIQRYFIKGIMIGAVKG